MASQYTSFIENGKCTSAKQFLKLCLRNFGVMQMYRDEPLSLDFEPDFAIQKDYVKPVYDSAQNWIKEEEENIKQMNNTI